MNFDESSVGPLLNTIVKIVAYIAPFFLIPATFKVGMGVFGNLAGMVNDRSRGIFDRQRKKRGDIRSREMAKSKAGERFNNRGLNALTSRASTNRLGYGAKGRAAYQQKINNAGIDFAKSAEGQAVQHNDNALRALTYGSAIEARSGLRKDFGMNDAQIEEAVAAAQAAGGFGRNRQTFAAAQLSRTGTGYDDLGQVAKTIARVSHGNTSQAAALAGDINASTKQAGRYDLAPGFGSLNYLAQAEMAGGEYREDIGGGLQKRYKSDKSAYDAANVNAARGVDSVSLLRGKKTQVQNLADSLKDHAATNQARMNNVNLDASDRAAAQDEFIKTMGQIDQLNQSKSYASQDNQEVINKLLDSTREMRTQQIDQVLGRQYEPGGERKDKPQDLSQQQVDARERYDQVRSPRYNPNDPNNQN